MKKEILTHEHIKQDIIDHIGTAKGQTWREYRVWLIATVLCALAFLVLKIICPTAATWLLLTAAANLLAILGCGWLRTLYRKKHVCIDDYEIMTETLYDKEEEHYSAVTGKHQSRPIDNRILYFANGKAFFVPEQGCIRRTQAPLSKRQIYENAQRGDKFIVVTHKKTGEIVAAYPTSLFAYKGE